MSQKFNYVQDEPTTSEVVRMLVIDLAEGDYTSCRGILDYLINEKGYTVDRIVQFATRTLQIPYDVAIATVVDMYSYCEEITVH